MDHPGSQEVLLDGKFIQDPNVLCELSHTCARNRAPPLITRVCRESRSAAFHFGKAAILKNNIYSREAHIQDWDRYTTLHEPEPEEWNDCIPDVVHMYWDISHTVEYSFCCGVFPKYAPIQTLAATAAKFTAGKASLMVDCLGTNFRWEGHWNPYMDDEWADSDIDDDVWDAPPPLREPTVEEAVFMKALQRLENCLVVVQEVVVHADLAEGAKSNLFEPLGDAPIQIIDMAEEDEIDRCFAIALECENRSPVSNPQDLERRSLHLTRDRLRLQIVASHGSEDLMDILRPAIMFRHCTLMCNHPVIARNRPLPMRLRQPEKK